MPQTRRYWDPSWDAETQAPPVTSRRRVWDPSWDEEEEEGPNLWERAVPMALRVVPPLVTGIATSATGPGALAAAGVAGGIGEALARKYERSTGQRGESQGLLREAGAIGTAAGLSAIPGTQALKIPAMQALRAATGPVARLARVGLEAGYGTLIGAAGAPLTIAAERGELPTWEEAGQQFKGALPFAAGIGGGVGVLAELAGAHPGARRIAPPVDVPTTPPGGAMPAPPAGGYGLEAMEDLFGPQRRTTPATPAETMATRNAAILERQRAQFPSPDDEIAALRRIGQPRRPKPTPPTPEVAAAPAAVQAPPVAAPPAARQAAQPFTRPLSELNDDDLRVLQSVTPLGPALRAIQEEVALRARRTRLGVTERPVEAPPPPEPVAEAAPPVEIAPPPPVPERAPRPPRFTPPEQEARDELARMMFQGREAARAEGVPVTRAGLRSAAERERADVQARQQASDEIQAEVRGEGRVTDPEMARTLFRTIAQRGGINPEKGPPISHQKQLWEWADQTAQRATPLYRKTAQGVIMVNRPPLRRGTVAGVRGVLNLDSDLSLGDMAGVIDNKYPGLLPPGADEQEVETVLEEAFGILHGQRGAAEARGRVQPQEGWWRPEAVPEAAPQAAETDAQRALREFFEMEGEEGAPTAGVEPESRLAELLAEQPTEAPAAAPTTPTFEPGTLNAHLEAGNQNEALWRLLKTQRAPLKDVYVTQLQRYAQELPKPTIRPELARALRVAGTKDRPGKPSLATVLKTVAPAELTDVLLWGAHERADSLGTYIAHHANQPHGVPGGSQTVGELAEPISDALTELRLRAQQRGRPAPPEAPRLSPTEDILPTGEVQPRLPGAEDVRERETLTPEFELPFSLTRQAGERPPVTAEDLFRPPESAPQTAAPTPEATAVVDADAQELLAIMSDLKAGALRPSGSLVYIPDLRARAASAGIDGPAFEAALQQLQSDRTIQLQRHSLPADLSPTERAQMVTRREPTGEDTVLMAAGVWEDTPRLQAARAMVEGAPPTRPSPPPTTRAVEPAAPPPESSALDIPGWAEESQRRLRVIQERSRVGLPAGALPGRIVNQAQPTAPPTLSPESIQRGRALADDLRLPRPERPATALTQTALRDMEGRHRALLADGSPEALDRYADEFSRMAEDAQDRVLRSGTGAEASRAGSPESWSTYGGLGFLQVGIDHLKLLQERNPQAFNKVLGSLVRAGMGAGVGYATAPEGMEAEFMALGAAGALYLGRKRAPVPGDLHPIYAPRNMGKDISGLEQAISLPERVVPDVYKKLSPYVERWEAGIATEGVRTSQTALDALRKETVEVAAKIARKEAEIAGKAGFSRRKAYLNELADAVEGKSTGGEQFLAQTLGLSVAKQRLLGAATAKVTYRTLLGYGIDTAAANLTQPILALAHVDVQDLIAAGKSLMSREAGAWERSNRVALTQPLDLSELLAGVGGKAESATPGMSAKLLKTADKYLIDRVPNSLIRGTDSWNRRLVYLAGIRKAMRSGKSEQEAMEWALQLMRKTQGEGGPLGGNPYWRGPMAILLKPFTKYPSLFVHNMADALNSPDALGRLRLVAGMAGLSIAAEQAFGLDVGDMLVSGGRPLGLNVRHPLRSLEQQLQSPGPPVVRGLVDAYQHAKGTATHRLLPENPLTTPFDTQADLGTLLLGRYPQKVKRTIEAWQSPRTPEGLIRTRTPSGATSDITEGEALANLLGLRSKRQTERSHIMEQAYAQSARTSEKQRARTALLRGELLRAIDRKQYGAAQKIRSQMSPESYKTAIRGLNRDQFDRLYAYSSKAERRELLDLRRQWQATKPARPTQKEARP